MKIFKIDDHKQIVCEYMKTRNAFKHEAALIVDGREVSRVKISYLNRTWERFEFESVINKLLDAQDPPVFWFMDKRKAFMDSISGHDSAAFKGIAMIALLGDIFHAGDQKASNDWKARMLKAGLTPHGLIMPDDWEQLSEEDKETRLNNVIAQIK